MDIWNHFLLNLFAVAGVKVKRILGRRRTHDCVLAGTNTADSFAGLASSDVEFYKKKRWDVFDTHSGQKTEDIPWE